MSRAYDAKQAVLEAHPTDMAKGVRLFYTIMDCGPSDFRYENRKGGAEYCYGEAGKPIDAEYEDE
jgi:hypothetical protein